VHCHRANCNRTGRRVNEKPTTSRVGTRVRAGNSHASAPDHALFAFGRLYDTRSMPILSPSLS
jgi:hypothetical protein